MLFFFFVNVLLYYYYISRELFGFKISKKDCNKYEILCESCEFDFTKLNLTTN